MSNRIFDYLRRKHRFCVDCRKPFALPNSSGNGFLPFKSKFPYCATCLLRRAEDPDFKTWILRKFGIIH